MEGAGSGAVTVDYSDGSPAVRLQADGGGVLYYPAEAEGGPPVIAVTIVAVNKYQTQVYIYEHPRDGRPGAGSALKSSGRRARRAVVRKGQPTGQLMLGSMNEHGVGFLQEHVLGSPGGSSSPSSPTGGRLLAAVRGVEDAAALVSTRSPPASPGSSRSSSRQRSAQPRHSPSSATQAVGKSLSLTEKGGQVCEEGRVVAVWRWDGRGDAPPPLVTLQLNSSMRAEWRSRTDATLFFSAGGVQYEVPLGQQLRRTSTYLANSSPTLGEPTSISPSGGGTGRQVVSGGRLMHVTSPSLASRTAEIGAEASAKRMLLHPASSAVKHAGLAAVMAGLEDAFTPWKARAASHSRASREVGRRGGRRGATAPPGDSRSATAPRLASTAPRTSTASARVLSSTAADLRMAAREQTMMEAPRWLTQPTGAGRSTDGATPKATGDAAGLVAPSEAGVADPGASMQAALRSSGDGYGGVGGASWHGGRWLSAPATRSKLAQHHKPLPRSQALTRNSGRYDAAAAGTVPSRGPSGATVRERLQVVPCQQLDTWLAGQEAVGGAGALHPDALALVAVLREDDSACRKAARLVEGVNGTLAALYPLSPEFAGERGWEEDERALALAAAKVAGGGTHAPGLGPDGSLAPYRMVRVNAAEDAGWVKERGIRTLPYFMAYFKGALVYAGVLGGTGKVKVKPVGVAPNALLALRDPASQLACERLLKAQGVPSSLAPPSRFDVASGSMVGVADAAAARVEELRAAAAASQARLASAQAASSSRGLGGGAGTDATLASRAAFALAILESELPAEEATGVRKALGGGSGSPDAGGAPAAPVSNVRRDHLAGGETLVVSLLPRGSVPPGSVKWPTDPGLGGGPAGAFLGAGKDSGAAKTRRAGGLAAAQFHRRRGRRERLLARSASLAMSGPASDSQAVSSPVLDGPAPPQGQPWACPHTGIVQGATQTHLLHGVASIAVVSPMKPATLAALLRVYHSAWGHGGGSAGLLPGQDAGEAGTGDAPHLGLTHNDLLSRLAALKEAGEAGSSLPGDFLVSGGGIALSSSETVVRGVPLVKS